ncbi:MAG: hypothetical protein JST58_17230 [Bacteroidetes bacterium]|nr:hypothetical protein [Bacteroidota bacterium]
MKTFIPFFSVAIVLVISSISAKLYLQQNYISSAALTLLWVVGAANLIGQNTLKLKSSK